MVYRIYAEKKPGLADEAAGLTAALLTFLRLARREFFQSLSRM